MNNNYLTSLFFFSAILSIAIVSPQLVVGQVSLDFATYFGGSNDEEFSAVAVGKDGTSYYFGKSKSNDLPTTSGAAQRYILGKSDAVLVAVDSDGNLKWSTFVGTTDDEDHANGLAITPDGRFLYLAFTTDSKHLLGWISPTSFQPTNIGKRDVVLAKIRRNGAVVWSTFLGGSEDEESYRVKATPDGGVILAGATKSSDFPTKNAFDNSFNGDKDGFVAHFDKDGLMVTSSYVGGSKNDIVFAADMNSSGTIALVGSTRETDWLSSPTLLPGDSEDYFLITAKGNSIQYSSYLGGTSDEKVSNRPDVVIDEQGRVFAAGTTSSPDFPIASAFQPLPGGQTDGFVTAFTNDGTIDWSTYIGGTEKESLTSIAIHGDLLLLGGNTDDIALPFISTNAYQISHGGKQDGMILLMRKHGSLAHATYLGGSDDDEIRMLAHTESRFSWVGNSSKSGSLIYNALFLSPDGGDDGHFGSLSIAEIDGEVDSSTKATSCEDSDANVTLQIDATMLGASPYDLSLDGGESWPDSLSSLTPNASNQLVYNNLQWGTYKVYIRDALGSISTPNTLNISGCEVEICTATSTATLEFEIVEGATNYAWTTTIGTISSGQGTESVEINTDGLLGGASGTVCVQPEGDACYAPQVCIDVLIACPEICTDSIDNDGDGVIDCEDEDCPKVAVVIRVTRD